MASFQKKLAAKVLKVGVSKVWLDPKKVKDIEKAITRIDIKKLIKQSAIKRLSERVPMPKEKKGRRHRGSFEGSANARVTSKQRWIRTVRPLRRLLVELKTSKQIDRATYQKMRSLVKGGMFRSRSHMRLYLEQHGLLKK